MTTDAPTRSGPRIAKRLQGLTLSDIRVMTRECERVSGINLGQGLCDLPTPPLVARGAADAIAARKSTYSFPEGVVELRSAVAAKLAREVGVEVDPANQVVITVGATGAFAATINALLDPGDGILLLEPYYGYHLNCAIVAGLSPRFLTLEPPRFALDEAALEAAVDAGTRALVLCTPSNPSGKMYDESELAAVARVAERHDLLVITDEIYEYIRYDGRAHIPPATIGGLAERTVSIGGVSKTFSVTGWRLGWAIAPPQMARAITLVNDLYYVCAPTPLQHAAAAGFSAPASFFSELAADYQRKRDVICEALDAGGMNPIVPQGAYYVLAEIGHLGFDSAKRGAMALLEQTGVASVPGSSFYRGATGERLLRFCFAKEDDVLAEAAKRLRTFKP